MNDLRVREIAPGDSLRPFIDLAWKTNAGDPNWVPPLRMAVEPLLDRRKHPFHRHAEVAYFLAERGGEAVGRVAAIVNRAHNDYHGDTVGFFGFFESVDDPAVAGALLDAAAGWLRARGRTVMRGPMNFSTNEECGLLVDGFDSPPTIMMTHNPRFYGALLEGAGMEKARDLLAYWIPGGRVPERLVRGAERIARRDRVRVRTLRMDRLDEEIRIIERVYNAAWNRNWGFVPMTAAEFAAMAKDLKPVADPDLCLIAEVDGEAVGFSLALPDLNQALKHLPDGRLFPFGLLKLLWHKRKIDVARLITLGFTPEYQKAGLGTLLYLKTFETGIRKGYRGAEASWILEDNWEMRRAIERIGAYVVKTYRIYDRAL